MFRIGRVLALAMILVAPWWLGSVAHLPRLILYGLAIASLCCLWFGLAFSKRSGHHFPWLALPVIAGLLLLVAQTRALPESVSPLIAVGQSAIYNDFAAPAESELLSESGAADNPTRLSTDLDGTRQSFNLLMLALLSLLIGSYFFSSRRVIVWLPLAVTINGVAISCYGIVQRLKPDNRIFGFIELPNGGFPFGPFVNQNNAAGYLLICLACSIGLVVIAFNRRIEGRRPRLIITNEYPVWQRIQLHVARFLAELDAPRLMTMLACLVITLGIASTLSRGGLLGLVVAATVSTVYYSLVRRSFSVLLASGVVLVFVVASMGYLGFGDPLMRRLAQANDHAFLNNDVRLNHWMETAPAIGDFAPLGSGVGSYDNIHRMYRKGHEAKLFYFAENQYFQTLVEAGWPGLLLLILALVILVLCVQFLGRHGNSPKTNAVCLIGVFLVSGQVVVAIFDFGLFIPANAVTMAMVCGMLAGQAHSLAERLKTQYWFRFNFPLFLNMLLLLLVFAAGLFAALDAWRYTANERALGEPPVGESYSTTGLDEVDARIARLQSAALNAADARVWRRLAELYILRYRLMVFDQQTRALTREQREDTGTRDDVWFATSLERLHGEIHRARQARDQTRLDGLRQQQAVRENLLPAIWYLQQSRARSPVQPHLHLLLAQLHSVAEDPNADVPHLLRAQASGPGNAVTWFISGLMDLNANRLDSAGRNFNRCLILDPANYNLVVRAVLPNLSAERVLSEVLPDDAFMLNDFAINYLTAKSTQSLRIETLHRARLILEEEPREDRKSLVLLSDLQNRLGDAESAIETLKLAADRNPDVQQIRIKLVHLLADNRRYDEALEQLRVARRTTTNPGAVARIREKIEKMQDEYLYSE